MSSIFSEFYGKLPKVDLINPKVGKHFRNIKKHFKSEIKHQYYPVTASALLRFSKSSIYCTISFTEPSTPRTLLLMHRS